MTDNQSAGRRRLTAAEITALEHNGCSAADWGSITVVQDFNPMRCRRVRFSGVVSIGRLEGEFTLDGGITVQSAIEDARLHNCSIGNGVYIGKIANYIANYNIADGAFIENTGCIAATGNSAFGIATRVSVLNETGGREVPVYEGLSAQLAYMIAMFRHDDALISRLCDLIDAEAAKLRGSRGVIGAYTRIVNCGEVLNVRVGDHAEIRGASRLAEGTIAASASDPVKIGANVIAENFIICSGAHVTDGAVVMNCFVGQACSISHLFSAHDSLFFANCVCENGEAAAIFAGPYTVTMHKSSLLIAGMYSFLNAGSGSNQSNHMYKLGPIHQGVVGRGSKTTSDSYILWPARIGPFSLVMGRHVNHPDTSDLPFSYLIENHGRSFLVPGVNIKSVGTVRDARKWPQRDKRRAPRRLDRINFNLLSPFTAQKMMRGIDILNSIELTGGLTADTYTYRGMTIDPRALDKGRGYYRMALDKFMGNSLIHRLRNIGGSDPAEIAEALRPTLAAGSGEWIDLAGMIAPKQQVEQLCADIASGRINSLADIDTRLDTMAATYYEMEWTWVAEHFSQWCGKSCSELTADDIAGLAMRWRHSVVALDRMLHDDARKEFSRISHIGFGADGDQLTAEADFRSVRGDFESDPFVEMVTSHIQAKSALADDLLHRLSPLLSRPVSEPSNNI